MLQLQQFFVKERAGIFKTANAYDILNPATQQPVGVAQEKPNMLMRIIFKEKAPTAIEVRDTAGNLALTVHKPLALFGRPKIKVTDAAGAELGYFVSKMFSIGGGFHVYTPQGQAMAEVKGNWKAKDFRMVTPDGTELGKVSKQWAGMAKEFFTSADNYVVGVADAVAGDVRTKVLMLAAALTIDVVYNEG
ncbi:MAG TPA: phospholipid scramblase-related protein [Humisphaera sp.]